MSITAFPDSTAAHAQPPTRHRLVVAGYVDPALVSSLDHDDWSIERVSTGAEATAVDASAWLLPLRLPDGHGPEVMRSILDRDPEAVVVVHAASASTAFCDRLVAAGAWAVITSEDSRRVAASLVTAGLRVAVSRARSAELQAALEHANRLQLAGQMSAEVAHEIGNSVAYISANLRYLGDHATWRSQRKAELAVALDSTSGDELDVAALRGQLSTWLHGDDSEELRCLDETMDGVRRVNQISRSLRTLTCRRRRLHPRRFSVEEVARDAMAYATVKAGARAELVFRVENSAEVMGQPDSLLQVLINLLFNAITALPDGTGRVSLTVGTQQVDGDEVVSLSVEDDGPGVPDDVRGSLFEPFVTTHEADGGTGLGLSICRDIVGQHQGTIALEGGSRFVVCLPLAPPLAGMLDLAA